MFQCCTRWEHVEETPYLIDIDPAERDGSPFGELEDESAGATGDEGPAEGESPVDLDLSLEDWDNVNDELDDFLNGTDTDDDDNECDSDSIRSDNSTASDAKQNEKKRKRGTKSTDVSDAEESDNSSASKLQHRKKRTMERVTSLTNVTTLEKSSGLPSPDTTGPEEGQGDDEEKVLNGVAPDLQEDYDDGLEAELLAGFDNSDDETS
jgi:RNA polymerase II subunit A-like phosphatase